MDKILEKIESDKEILSTLPKNTKKNIAKYLETVNEIKLEYVENKNKIFKEMQKRYNKIISVKKMPEINKIEIEIKDIEIMLNLLDDTKTSYEKMEIDKSIYKLGKFYKENLENINEEILLCINKFQEIGLDLTSQDFDYSIYVTEYMETFFKEAEKEDINSDIMKSKFEEIYWKCPDIIIHIELNLRYIYLKKKNFIDKYYEKRKNELLSTVKLKPKEIWNKYIDLNKKLDDYLNIDKYLIINKFLQGIINPKDYEEDKIKANYEKIFTKEILNNIDKSEIDENITKFMNSLYEYKNFLKFQYIFENIKKKYLERQQFKNAYNVTKKEIAKKEGKLKSLNKKINSNSIFSKKKETKEKQSAEYNKLIMEIKALYKKFDENEIYSKIIENLSDNSTIYDVLSFANSFNNFLIECIIVQEPSIEQKEIEKTIEELKIFLKDPYNTIIKNITILEEKDIPIIISDRYKLLNFNITKEEINDTNIDTLISTLNTICTKNNIVMSGIKLKDVEFMCEFKKILDKNK